MSAVQWTPPRRVAADYWRMRFRMAHSWNRYILGIYGDNDEDDRYGAFVSAVKEVREEARGVR